MTIYCTTRNSINVKFAFVKCLLYFNSTVKAQIQTDFELLPIVPIDDDTRAMLAYAASMDGRAHIEQARRELQEGKGIIITISWLANFPGIGKTDHDYATDLVGFPLKHNWIFYEADHHKVRFIHIIPSRRNRASIRF